MTHVAVQTGLSWAEMRTRVTERQAAQLPKFDGVATLVTLRGGARPISSARAASALRNVSLSGIPPVFVAVPALTAEAVSFLEALDVVLLRDPPQNVVGWTDNDLRPEG